MKKYSIILASGSGTRFNCEKPKQFIKIAGKTILEHTVEIFEKNNLIDEIIIVVTPLYKHLVEEIVIKNHYRKITKILNGGESRQESSFIGIDAIDDNDSAVIIHDCVRPFLSNEIINNCIEALKKYDAVDVAIKATDTIIEIDQNQIITCIPNRNHMRRGQTPQCFKTSLIKKAHQMSVNNNDHSFTDDCGLVLKYKLADIFVVNGEEKNIKITYPEDIYLADKFFQINHILAPDIRLSKLKNKNIIIFGASSGIGKSIKKIGEKYGANVFGFSRENNVDITDYDKVKKTIEKVYKTTKRIDYVVNTAGILNIGKLEDRDYSSIINEISVNYIGSINIAKVSFPYLKKSGGGLLFFTSSSYTRGRALYSVYSSTKSAIVNLTQALSEETYDDDIKVNAINPERTATPMRIKNFGKEPPNTLLDPDDVAKKSLQVLLSNLTGQIIDVRK